MKKTDLLGHLGRNVAGFLGINRLTRTADLQTGTFDEGDVVKVRADHSSMFAGRTGKVMGVDKDGKIQVMFGGDVAGNTAVFNSFDLENQTSTMGEPGEGSEFNTVLSRRKTAGYSVRKGTKQEIFPIWDSLQLVSASGEAYFEKPPFGSIEDEVSIGDNGTVTVFRGKDHSGVTGLWWELEGVPESLFDRQASRRLESFLSWHDGNIAQKGTILDKQPRTAKDWNPEGEGQTWQATDANGQSLAEGDRIRAVNPSDTDETTRVDYTIIGYSYPQIKIRDDVGNIGYAVPAASVKVAVKKTAACVDANGAPIEIGDSVCEKGYEGTGLDYVVNAVDAKPPKAAPGNWIEVEDPSGNGQLYFNASETVKVKGAFEMKDIGPEPDPFAGPSGMFAGASRRTASDECLDMDGAPLQVGDTVEKFYSESGDPTMKVSEIVGVGDYGTKVRLTHSDGDSEIVPSKFLRKVASKRAADEDRIPKQEYADPHADLYRGIEGENILRVRQYVDNNWTNNPGMSDMERVEDALNALGIQRSASKRVAYSGDPYWTKSKYPATCKGCGKPIQPGDDAFLFKDRSMFCDGPNCGQKESDSFNQSAQDESFYNSAFGSRRVAYEAHYLDGQEAMVGDTIQTGEFQGVVRNIYDTNTLEVALPGGEAVRYSTEPTVKLLKRADVSVFQPGDRVVILEGAEADPSAVGDEAVIENDNRGDRVEVETGWLKKTGVKKKAGIKVDDLKPGDQLKDPNEPNNIYTYQGRKDTDVAVGAPHFIDNNGRTSIMWDEGGFFPSPLSRMELAVKKTEGSKRKAEESFQAGDRVRHNESGEEGKVWDVVRNDLVQVKWDDPNIFLSGGNTPTSELTKVGSKRKAFDLGMDSYQEAFQAAEKAEQDAKAVLEAAEDAFRDINAPNRDSLKRAVDEAYDAWQEAKNAAFEIGYKGPAEFGARITGSKRTAMDSFLMEYLTTALWSSSDNSDESGGEPLDKNYSISDITPESIQKAEADCAKFQEMVVAAGLEMNENGAHDFWLTRNHHGAGFWDGDYEKSVGEKLTEIAHSFGECDLMVDDDGKISIYP